jgi:hypothetical protein
MIKQIINEFRKQNGRPPVSFDDYIENQYCFWHCHYMARIQECCHAPENLRNGKAEAVGGRGIFHDPYDTLRAIVFGAPDETGKITGGFANSPEHREIILMDNLAGAFHMDFMNHFVFVTIRGW